MHEQVYINLPVKDVKRSRKFFTSLGYGINEQYSDDKALCVLFSDNIIAMLLHQDFIATFTNKPIAMADTQTGVLVCLKCENKAEVDALVAKALAAGGTTPMESKDYGFMYQHGFQDLDGHCWELVSMPAAQS
ncbi:MAG: VOC family protein [Pseudomonadota bacterium]